MKRLITLILFAAVTLQAQVRDSIEVRLVEVTVTVTDEKGNPVRTLKAEDFEVLDEGKKQTVTNFDVVDYSVPVPASARTPAARRNFLLLFDVTNSAPASLMRARHTALEFVTKQAANLDRIAVATISSQHGIHLLTSFTTDRELVTAAIKTMGSPKFYQPRDPLLISLATPSPVPEAVSDIEAAVLEYVKELTVMGQKAAADAQRFNVEKDIAELTELGQALDHVTGRKQVILFSEGFDPKSLSGRSSLSSTEAREEQQFAELGQIWRVDSDNRYGNASTGANLRRMIEAMRRSDVVLHAMDIKGLRTDVDASAGLKHVSNEGLYLLSHDTGGMLFKNSNSLTTDLGRFLKGQEVTYSLGYRAQRGAPGKFRRLAVKVPSMPNANVSYRLGYYEPANATNALDRTLQSTDIILNRIPVQDLKVTAYAAATPQKASPGLVPVVLEIDGKGLLRSSEGAGDASAEIFVYAFDDDDRARDALHQRMTFDLSKIKQETLAAGLKFYGNLRLQQGEYSVRVLVRSGGKNGFVEIPVVVPSATEQYAAMPMMFGDMNSGLKVRAPARPGDQYPFFVADTTFLPATHPILKPGVPREMVLYLYNVPMDSLEVKAALGSHNAALALVGRTEKDDNGAVKLLMNVTAPPAAVGAANLLVTIGGRAGADLQQVSIPVRVE
jgi:VWFA-related protein